MTTCRYCGGPTRGRETDIRCSSPDCKRAFQRERNLKWQHAYVQKNGQWPNARNRSRKTGASCTGCGKPTRGGRGVATKCRACHHPRRSRQDKALEKLAKAAAGTRGRRTFPSGRCMRCGEWFVGRSVMTRWCSVSCKRRDKAATRRALEAGVKVTPGRRYTVHERDSWTCRICGDPVDRDAKVPELDAPTIDHIVPLARGGAHAPENWQTAHFYCNSDKRDQLGFEFVDEEEA